MGAFDGAVLVGNAGVVPGRGHAIKGAERLVAARHIFLRVGVEIAEGGGETVAAVLVRRASEHPQGILQAFGESDIGGFET